MLLNAPVCQKDMKYVDGNEAFPTITAQRTKYEEPTEENRKPWT